MKSLAVVILLWSTVLAARQTQTAVEPNPSKPVRLAEETAAALVTKRVPPVYPVKALVAGIQGTVVLNVTISETGDVKEATLASGEPDLAQAAIDSIKQWKYRPYMVAGNPTPFETQVSFGFRDKAHSATPPPPGRFKDGKYQNEFFGLSYPLSSEWIRLAPSQSRVRPVPGEEILLVEAHAPVPPDTWNTPSGFVLTTAIPAPNHSDAKEDLAAMVATVSAVNKATQEAKTSQFDVAGVSFYRADFKLSGDQYQTLVCTMANGRLFRWNFAAASKGDMKKAVETIHFITKLEAARPNPDATIGTSEPGASTGVSRMSLSSEALAASLRKKVKPDCAGDSIVFGGKVTIHVIVDNEGNVSNLGIVGSPSVGVPAAIDAVSKWKYKPLVVNGQAMEVDSTVDLNVPHCRISVDNAPNKNTLGVQ
jgi:TonB family protein